MREPVVEKSDKAADKKPEKKEDKRDARKPGDAGKQAAKPDAAAKPDPAKPDAAAKPDDKPADAEADDADANDTPSIVAPERGGARSATGLYEFRDERWVELYAKKIEELIAVLKSKNVPVLWVGLPAIRGTKGISDMLFLDAAVSRRRRQGGHHLLSTSGTVSSTRPAGSCKRARTSKARSASCVPMTACISQNPARASSPTMSIARSCACSPRAPARSRCRASRRRPMPTLCPVQPAPRPLAGPILPLVASAIGTDQLLGGPGSRPASVDALAARTLVKGEALAPPAGRAE